MFTALVAFIAFFFWFVPQFVHAPASLLEKSAPKEEPKASILFGGDMMFDRFIRQKMMSKGDEYIFSCVDDVLRGADLVVANLEGPITALPSVSASSTIGSIENMTFTFSTSTARVLARRNIRLVNIGNNHIMNFGRDGLLQTKDWLDNAGIAYFGDPDKTEEERVERTDIAGIPFSFVNWSDWTSDKTDRTVQQVRTEAAASRVTVVYTHWGEEYATTSSPRAQQLARSFVDAGAALVVGSHPHVVQEHELYRDKHIYYSLGNFVFDQYWNDNVRNGLLLRVTFTPTKVEDIQEIPIRLERDGRTCLIE